MIRSIINQLRGKHLVLCRSDAERLFLEKWLQSPAPVTAKEHVVQSPHTLADLKGMIDRCIRCQSEGERKYPYGNGTNHIMIILNPPPMIPGHEKKSLKNESIVLMKKIISSMQVDFDACYITSIIKCEMPHSSLSPSQVLQQCLNLLQLEIDIIKPSLVLAMGQLLPLKSLISANQGISWFTVDHPLTLIKNPELKKQAWQTIKLIIAQMNKNGPIT